MVVFGRASCWLLIVRRRAGLVSPYPPYSIRKYGYSRTYAEGIFHDRASCFNYLRQRHCSHALLVCAFSSSSKSIKHSMLWRARRARSRWSCTVYVRKYVAEPNGAFSVTSGKRDRLIMTDGDAISDACLPACMHAHWAT
jgi:hypothetical protein